MYAIIGLAFCILLGVSIKAHGFVALLWFPLGFILGLFITAQIVLPIILSLPRAVRLIFRREMRIAVIGHILLTPVIWFVILFLFGFFWPSAADFLYNNAPLNIGSWVGTIAIILLPLSANSRADFRNDFEKAYQKFYIRPNNLVSQTITTHSTSDISQQNDCDAELKRAQDELAVLTSELELLENPETICSFGQMAYDGDGVEQDYIAAANWYRMAGEKGNSRAQHNLAVMYESGDGVVQSFTEAAKWYRMAAAQGHPGSQNNLGSLYEAGNGVAQDYAIALDWYQKAAKGGDKNAETNFKNLRPRVELERYQKIVFAFSDLMTAHAPLIGDCASLPYSKATILYAIKFVVDDYETKLESVTDSRLIESYKKMIPTLNYLLTCLVRDWHEIAPEDKEAIARLKGCDSLPEWALYLKHKYINEERAREEALDVALQVLRDKVGRENA